MRIWIDGKIISHHWLKSSMDEGIWSINSAENPQFQASVDGSGTDGAAGPEFAVVTGTPA